MAKYLTRQRKRLLEYLSAHTDEQISARQIAEDLAADQISISAVYRNISALEDKGSLLPIYCVRRMQRQPAPGLPRLRKEYSFRRAGSDAADSRNIRKHWLSD